MHFTHRYDIEFSKYLVTFDAEKMHPVIPYVKTNGEGQPIIHVNIGSGTAADMTVDTGAFYSEVSGKVAEAVGLKNYPYVNTKTRVLALYCTRL